MPRTEKYFVGPTLLGEIRQTITRVAGMPDRTSGASQPVRLQELPRRGGGGGIKICTFTGAWAINTYKDVRPIPPNTAVTTQSQVYQTKNLFADISSCGERYCAISSYGGTWFLIASQCQ